MERQGTGGTWITPLTEDPSRQGEGRLRVALKDVFQVAGLTATHGSRAVADHAVPAAEDAPCLAGLRAAGATIVGLANMHELGFGTTGLNPWYGNPVNRRWPDLVPGGSSSGPAAAIAAGEAAVGLGTDTGGSVRIPAACCGLVALKTTWGRVPLGGVAPLAPSMDTVGPMGRDVAGVVAGMALLEPGFAAADLGTARVGRIRVGAGPTIDAAVDRALSGWQVVELDPLEWELADAAARVQLLAEVHDTLGWLARERPEGLGDDTRRRFAGAAAVTDEQRDGAAAARRRWRAWLGIQFERFDLLALPTLVEPPPPLTDAGRIYAITRTRAVNLAGIPALSMPVTAATRVPPSLQLLAPWGAEDRLVAAAALVEAGGQT